MGSGQRPPGKMLCANSLFYIIPQLSEIFNNISGEEKPHGEPAQLGDFFVGDERFAIRGEVRRPRSGRGLPGGSARGGSGAAAEWGLLQVLQFPQPQGGGSITGHSPIPARGKGDRADLGAIRQAAALKLLLEEPAEEGAQPL